MKAKAKVAETARRHVQTVIAHGRRDFDHTSIDSSDVNAREALELHPVTIADIRQCAEQFSLEDCGFVLMRHPTAVSDFFDRRMVDRIYVPEMIDLIAKISESDMIVMLEKVVRGSNLKELHSKYPDYGNRILGFAAKAHIDGDEDTYRRWAAGLLGPAAAERVKTAPFTVYNVWRPITPVEQRPLAFCDARTVSQDDLIPNVFDGKYPGMGEDEYQPPVRYFHLAFNPAQRWYYFADMTPDEVVVFKQWDTDPDHARCVPHSAFKDPASRPDAAPRMSIEFRAVAFR